MSLTHSDILLFSIDELKRTDESDLVISRERFANIVGLLPLSLNAALSKLSKDGLIHRNWKHFGNNFIDNIDITKKGNQAILKIEKELENCYFTPERHNTLNNINFLEVYKKYNKSSDKILLLHYFFKKKQFDLEEYLGKMNIIKNDMNLINFFRKKEDIKTENDSYSIDIYKMSLCGDKCEKNISNDQDITEDDINLLLIRGETYRKQGRLDDAESIYHQILTIEKRISRNQWFQAHLGMAQTIRRKNNIDEALKYLEMMSKMTKNRLYLACIRQVQGSYYGYKKETNKAIRLLSSSIRSFRTYHHPILLANALNNRGVFYFMNNNIELANKDWELALRYAKEAKSKYGEAWMMCNLADIQINKGNFEKAEHYLDHAHNIFQSVDDLEGISLVEFNRGLNYIAQRDSVKAIQHYAISEKVAYPLPPILEKKMRREVILERAKKMGMIEIENFINALT